MNNRLIQVLASLAAACAIHTNAHAQQRPTDPLNSATQCFKGGEFHYENKDRLPPNATTRTIEMAAGPAHVSTADGYRLMIFRQSKSPLVNLKIERSADGQFAADRATIIAQMEEIAGNVQPAHHMQVETSTRDGIAIAAINNPSIDRSPGIISMVTLFDAASNTIATAYMLNQRPPLREFANDADYVVLRERFIDALSACLARTARVTDSAAD